MHKGDVDLMIKEYQNLKESLLKCVELLEIHETTEPLTAEEKVKLASSQDVILEANNILKIVSF